MYDGFLSNAAEDVEGAIPVIIKTVKGNRVVLYLYLPCKLYVCWHVICETCHYPAH